MIKFTSRILEGLNPRWGSVEPRRGIGCGGRVRNARSFQHRIRGVGILANKYGSAVHVAQCGTIAQHNAPPRRRQLDRCRVF